MTNTTLLVFAVFSLLFLISLRSDKRTKELLDALAMGGLCPACRFSERQLDDGHVAQDFFCDNPSTDLAQPRPHHFVFSAILLYSG